MKNNSLLPDDQRILHLIALLRNKGVRHVVLCPGSRNIPLIQAFTYDGFICHKALDERHGGFLALGMAQSLNEIVAIVCTSGTALLNFSPSIAEAYYSNSSILVISADRPQEMIGQNQGQTLPHMDAFQGIIRYQVQLPSDSIDYSNRLINEAIIALEYPVNGPVHINIPISEPFFEFHTKTLPIVRSIQIENNCRFLEPFIDKHSIVWVIIGNRANIYRESLVEIHSDVLIFDEFNQTNLPSFSINRFLDTLSEDFFPNCIITLGGDIVNKRLKQFVKQLSPEFHIHLSKEFKVVDTFNSLSHIVVGNVQYLLNDCMTLLNTQKPLGLEKKKFDLAESFIDFTQYNSQAIVAQILHDLSEDTALFLGNSSIIRQAINVCSSHELHCNRGCSGIEGSLSTAVGSALVNKTIPHVVILGDLSYYYDISALTFHVEELNNLCVFVINNRGGAIFDKIKGAECSPKAHSYISFYHNQTSKGWNEDMNSNYIQINTIEEWKLFRKENNPFLEQSSKYSQALPMVVEIII